MRNLFKNFTIFLVVFLIIAGLLSIGSGQFEKDEEAPFNEVVKAVRQGEVEKIVIDDNKLAISFTDGSLKQSHKEAGEPLAILLQAYGATEEELAKVNIVTRQPSGAAVWFGAIAPFLIPFILIFVLVWFMMRQVSGANNRAMMFGAGAGREDDTAKKKTQKRVTFVDVAGNLEAKQELEEVVEFLRTPEKFQKLGARIPKGVLLVGPPGTGKTLLAKAVSGEAKAPFINISGSEFVEMFVGVGASRVRDLFKRAKKQAPAIIFIDELDAVGRQRGSGLGGSHDEREQTLNQILVEMDGFDTDTNIIIMAATNRPDVLDPALLRPGRFDRNVTIDLPDINDREAILKVHAKGKPLAKEVELRAVAQRTPGFSGADLFNLLNEAAILAARQNQTEINQADLFVSIEKVMLGPERKSYVMNEKEKKITAYHEAGHAVVAHHLPSSDPVHKVSIIARGRAGGYTLKLPTEDKRLHRKSEFIADLAVLLAGHAIETLVFADVTTGASSDLKRATSLSRQIITEYGMSEKMGPRTFGRKEELIFLGREISEQRDYSDSTADEIDKEMSRLLGQAYDKATELIKTNMAKVEKVVAELMEKETIEKEEFASLMS